MLMYRGGFVLGPVSGPVALCVGPCRSRPYTPRRSLCELSLFLSGPSLCRGLAIRSGSEEPRATHAVRRPRFRSACHRSGRPGLRVFSRSACHPSAPRAPTSVPPIWPRTSSSDPRATHPLRGRLRVPLSRCCGPPAQIRVRRAPSPDLRATSALRAPSSDPRATRQPGASLVPGENPNLAIWGIIIESINFPLH